MSFASFLVFNYTPLLISFSLPFSKLPYLIIAIICIQVRHNLSYSQNILRRCLSHSLRWIIHIVWDSFKVQDLKFFVNHIKEVDWSKRITTVVNTSFWNHWLFIFFFLLQKTLFLIREYFLLSISFHIYLFDHKICTQFYFHYIFPGTLFVN